ncbi:choice-of-anchor D domain-containing protein [Hyalangium versicolor]|uniref:choice-of-anchor D domain-containing protein n=1 Tax=Hyalangium versicolor TaxID=2861190 RepID=UPI001CCA9E54|nr:choice-of-anchor D domain-containing protein [Hyalangium versicolor]
MRQGWGWGRVLGLAVTAAMMAACHEPGNTRSVQAAAVVDREQLDFGEVPVGEWREQKVLIRNVGYVPFSALEALALQGNAAYQVELVEGGRVLPGESKEVLVRFHPLHEGPTEEQLRVATDANTGRESTVTVRGQGAPTPIRIDPPVLDFETLEVDSDRTLTLTVTNPVDLPLTVQVAGDGADPFSTDTVTIPPLSTQQLQAKYLPRALGQMGALVEARACEGCTPTTAKLVGNSVASAFVFEPTPVPFAPIPVHESTESRARVRNITWRPVTISELTTTDPSFSALTVLNGQTVGPNEAVELKMRFAARTSGPNTADLKMQYESDKPRETQVGLDARGGQPTLAVAPAALDFGELPVGGKVGKVIRISNGGTNGNLIFLGVRGDGSSGNFNVDVPKRGTQTYPWKGGTWPALEADSLAIAPGNDALELTVYFEPQQEGNLQATLTLASSDPFTPERTVVLTGRARASGPCVFELRPQPALDFGNVAPGRGAVLGVYMRNPGRAECAVKNIHISNDAGGAFFMPGGPLTGGVLPYDTAFSTQVAFRPPVAGSYGGELQLTVNDPAHPTVTLPLKGVSQASCLVAAPGFVDFGPIRYDCETKPRRTLISNQCPYPITVDGAQIGAGTSNQFQLITPLTAPRTLAPAEGFELEVTYARNVLGQHYSPLFVHATNEPDWLVVPLLAETNHEGVQLDKFVQGTDSQLDVLFVVSNTTTMETFQQRLQAAIPGWLDRARQEGVELRVAVTTTGLVPRGTACGGPAQGGEGGRIVPVDGSSQRVVSSLAAEAATALQANVSVGLCHNLVQGLETTRQALSSPLVDSQDDPRTALPNDGNLGFVRSTARLAVVAVADEDDHSGFEPDSYIQFLQAIKGPGMSHRTQFYALVPTGNSCSTAQTSAPRFSAVAQATGGAVGSVCEGDYQPFLAKLIGRAGDPQADFPLTSKPSGTAEMSVRVQGQTVDPSLWTYDASRNALVFKSAAVPKTGENIQIRYRSICQAPPATP